MSDDLLTTEEAARLAGVGPSSVKRWADQGVLTCIRTPGGHRRYDRRALERFLQSNGGKTASQATPSGVAEETLPERWARLLIGARRHVVESALLEARARLGAWYLVADEVAAGLAELGRRWACGNLSITQEHVASDCLERALGRVLDALPTPPATGRTALLACADGEEHTLGLSLAEVCLREAGWRTLWLGRRTPSLEIVQIVRSGEVQMVALSASQSSTDARRLRSLVGQVEPVCHAAGCELVLGGSGRWPAHPKRATRIESFRAFETRLRALEVRGSHGS